MCVFKNPPMEAWPDLVALRRGQTRAMEREGYGGRERLFPAGQPDRSGVPQQMC